MTFFHWQSVHFLEMSITLYICQYKSYLPVHIQISLSHKQIPVTPFSTKLWFWHSAFVPLQQYYLWIQQEQRGCEQKMKVQGTKYEKLWLFNFGLISPWRLADGALQIIFKIFMWKVLPLFHVIRKEWWINCFCTLVNTFVCLRAAANETDFNWRSLNISTPKLGMG